VLVYNLLDKQPTREMVLQGNRKLRRIDQDLTDLTNLLQNILEHKGDDFLETIAVGHQMNLAKGAIKRACELAQRLGEES